MSKLLYYLIIKPLSLLPLPVLYQLSNVVYWILYKLIGYRKKVVFSNLRNSFPDKSEKEIKAIADKFYSHLCDIVVESISIFSISEKEVIKRCKIINPEVADAYFEKGQSVIIAAGHYVTYEYAAVSLGAQMKHSAYGLMTTLTDKFLNKKMVDSRSAFGTGMIVPKYTREFYEENKDKLTAVAFIGDQSPGSNKGKYYWTTFLNQETPVMLGTEKYAKLYDLPVLFYKQRRVKRGYYTAEFIPLFDNPRETAEFEITEAHTRMVESMILEQPEYWLWSHKRWKHSKPV